jgi:hypothetical protein
MFSFNISNEENNVQEYHHQGGDSDQVKDDIGTGNGGEKELRRKHPQKSWFDLKGLDFRRWIFIYHSSLEEGRRSSVEQSLWKFYEKYIPYRLRVLDNEKGVKYPLPPWLEHIITFVYETNKRRILLFILAYITLVYASQPVLNLSNSVKESFNCNTSFLQCFSRFIGINTDSDELSGVRDGSSLHHLSVISARLQKYIVYERTLKQLIYNCLEFRSLLLNTSEHMENANKLSLLKQWHHNLGDTVSPLPEDTYCITQYSNIWTIPKTLHFDYETTIEKEVREATADNNIFFIDDEGNPYHLWNVLTPTSSFIEDVEEDNLLDAKNKKTSNVGDFYHYGEKKKNTKTTKKNVKQISLTHPPPVMVSERELINLLQFIDPHGKTCICPILIGLVANVTFLYRKDQQTWNILHSPYIYRNNTLSEEFETSVTYEKESLLYKNYKNYHKVHNEGHSIHYSVFNVEYSSFASIHHDENSESHSTGNVFKKMVRTLSNHHQNKLFYIPLQQEEQTTITRQRITLSEDDAICFIYCNNGNK